jgi:class 3 adenylate cyclase
MTRISLHLALLVSAAAIAAISGSTALIPLYREAFRSSEDAALNFADEVAAQVAVNIQYYVAKPQNFAASVAQATRLGAMSHASNESIALWLCDLVARSDQDILLIYYFDDASGFIAGRENTLNISALPPISGYTVLAYYNAGRQLADFWYVADGNVKFDGTRPNVTQHTSFNHTIRPYAAPFRGAKVPSLQSGDDPLQWAAPFVDFSQKFADFGLGGPIVNTTANSTIGLFGVFYRTSALKDYLATLRVAKNGRAFLVDSATDALLGSNAGDPAVSVLQNGTVVLATPSLLSGEVAQRAMQNLGGRMTSCTTRCSYTFGTGLDALFVTVIAVSDKYGLNLRVVVAVPAADFLSSIQDSLIVGVGAAAGVISGVLVISAFLLHCLLRPLRRLEERLYESSSLQYRDFPVQEEPSCLSEIATIETAYAQLVAELKKVRSFLPQSVLRQLDVEQHEDGAFDVGEKSQDFSRLSPISSGRGETSGIGALALDVELDAAAPPEGGAIARRPYRAGTVSSPPTESVDPPLSSAVDGDRTPPKAPAGGTISRRSHQLHLDGLLHSRRVTVLTANMCSFHKALQCVGADDLQLLHTAVTNSVLRTVNSHQGVLEWLHGDRFTASFNASLSCAAPAERACQTMISLLATLPTLEERGYTGMRFGAATGVALCGNLGCDAMRRFSVVGAVVNHAYALMQQTKLETVQNLVCAQTFQEAQRSFVLQYVNYVLLPQAATGALIATVIEARSARTPSSSPTGGGATKDFTGVVDERARRLKDMVSTVNEAFECFAQGDLPKVRELYHYIPKKHSAGLARLLRAVEHVQHQAGVSS